MNQSTLATEHSESSRDEVDGVAIGAHLRSTPRPAKAWMWLVSFLLFIPFYYPVLEHFLHPPPGVEPTGFIQRDMPYYLGNAREHFDDGFHLTYGLPYSPFYETPRLYFQPQTLFLGIVLKATGMDPATVYLLFGVVWGTVCCRLSLALFNQLFGLRTTAQWLACICFVWGGGLLVITGFFRWIGTRSLDDLLAFDPAGGNWFLNFGRNCAFPHEAYYHAVFLGAVLALLQKRYRLTLALCALVSASHPFTGVQLLTCMLFWAAVEHFWIRNPKVPGWFVAGQALLLGAHLGYYRLFLARSIEHLQLERQWLTVDFTYEAKHFIPAYALVALLTFYGCRSPSRAAQLFASPFARFLLAWAGTSFALANNEFAFKPSIQPLHFTRGYVWMPLFLLGAPALIALFHFLWNRRIKFFAVASLSFCVGVLALDNVIYLSTYHARQRTLADEVYMPLGFRKLATFLSEPAQHGTLLLMPNVQGLEWNPIAYLITVYTPLRTWHSHEFNSPLIAQRHREIGELFFRGTFLPQWSQVDLLIVLPPEAPELPWITARNGRVVYTDPHYRVWRIDASPAPR